MKNTVNKIISELQNKNILIIIFEFLDCSTLINCRMVTPLWAKLLLESSKLWEISFKNTYPFLYHQLIVKTPEEKLLIKELPDLDNLSWFLKTKMVLSFIHSDAIKKIKSNEEQISTYEDLINFALRIVNAHSWYKHLPGLPGENFYITQETLSVTEQVKKSSTEIPDRYRYCPSVMLPSNKNSINIWTYYNFLKLNEEQSKNFVINKLLTVFLNHTLSTLSSFIMENYKMNEKYKNCSFYEEYCIIRLKNIKNDRVRQILDIADACRNFIYLTYNKIVEEEDIEMIDDGEMLITKNYEKYFV